MLMLQHQCGAIELQCRVAAEYVIFELSHENGFSMTHAMLVTPDNLSLCLVHALMDGVAYDTDAFGHSHLKMQKRIPA